LSLAGIIYRIQSGTHLVGGLFHSSVAPLQAQADFLPFLLFLLQLINAIAQFRRLLGNLSQLLTAAFIHRESPHSPTEAV
jgi:hypothetical protein